MKITFQNYQNFVCRFLSFRIVLSNFITLIFLNLVSMLQLLIITRNIKFELLQAYCIKLKVVLIHKNQLTLRNPLLMSVRVFLLNQVANSHNLQKQIIDLMLLMNSYLKKQSSTDNMASRRVQTLKVLILESLDPETHVTHRVEPFGREFARDGLQDAEQHDSEQFLRECIENLSTLTSFPEPSDRTQWNSSIDCCRLQPACKYQLLLKDVYSFACELHRLGYPNCFRYNNSQLIKILDPIVNLIKRQQADAMAYTETRSLLVNQYFVIRSLAKKLKTLWLTYLSRRTLILTVVLNQLMIEAGFAENLRRFVPGTSLEHMNDAAFKRALKSFYKLQITDMIKRYVKRKQLELEICLNCQKCFPSHKMARHIRTCRQLYELDQHIESLDAEIMAKLQDLKEYATDIKKIQLQRQKENLQNRKVIQKRGVFKKDISKSSLCYSIIRRDFIDRQDQQSISNQNYDSDCESTDSQSHGPARFIQSLTFEELISYLWILDQLRTIGNKIKTQRESINMELFHDLKYIKSTVEPKYHQLNVKAAQVECVLKLMNSRVDCMQKIRKLKRLQRKDSDCEREEVDSFCSEFQNFKSSKTMRNERNRYKTQLKNADECYFSEEETSVRMSEQDMNNCAKVKDFKKIKRLGHGKYGEVWLVRKKSTRAKYAMKRVYIEDFKNYTRLEDLEAEKNVFSVIDSPYLVKAIYSFSEGNHHYFVMEYMPNGDFFQLLTRQVRLYEDEAKHYLAEIVLAIQALHNYGITHRDIKPQNIVIDKAGHLKITDYGLSEAGLVKRKQDEQKNKTLSKFVLKQLKKKKKDENKQDDRIVGSPYYMAPEVLSGAQSNQMSDWWSFGILVYHTLLGVPPFTGSNLDEIRQKVLKLQKWPSCVKFGKSEQMISFEAKDLIDKLLVLNPKYRLGSDVDDIKAHNFFDGIDWDNLRDCQPPISFQSQDRSISDEIQSQEGYQTQQDNKNSYCGSMNLNLIRRDLLNSQTQANHQKSQAKFARLLDYANRLEKANKII